MFKNRIIPMNEIEHTIKWERHRSDILNDIIKFGNIQHKYVHGTGTRVTSVIATGICITVCCSPCIIWDSLCCVLSCCFVKNNPCKWGCTFDIIKESSKNTFKDKRISELQTVVDNIVNKKIVYNVMKKYLNTFDECIALNTVDGAKKANVIRHELFKMYSACMLEFIKDNGDIDIIRNRINELELSIKSD